MVGQCKGALRLGGLPEVVLSSRIVIMPRRRPAGDGILPQLLVDGIIPQISVVQVGEGKGLTSCTHCHVSATLLVGTCSQVLQ
jgi:hypothetical protein